MYTDTYMYAGMMSRALMYLVAVEVGVEVALAVVDVRDEPHDELLVVLVVDVNRVGDLHTRAVQAR